MKKYEVPAVLNGKRVKFIVSTLDLSSNYPVTLYLLGKYKDDDLVIISSEIAEIVELDLTKEED